MDARFTKKTQLTKTDIYSFYFKPEKAIKFTAGQFIELSLGKNLKHWFTLSSSPTEPELTISTRLTNSPYKNRLNCLTKGEQVKISDPMGDFVLPIDQNVPVIMFAAGIGITPVLSILGYLAAQKDRRQLNVVYAASSEADFVDLSPYKANLAIFKQLVGHLEVKTILASLKTLDDPLIYISGPEKMVEALVKGLKSSGLDASRVIADYFEGYDRS